MEDAVCAFPRKRGSATDLTPAQSLRHLSSVGPRPIRKDSQIYFTSSIAPTNTSLR